MKIFEIRRTRTVDETFRVEAESENIALDMLRDSDSCWCVTGVEQIGLSTENYWVKVQNAEDTDSDISCGA